MGELTERCQYRREKCGSKEKTGLHHPSPGGSAATPYPVSGVLEIKHLEAMEIKTRSNPDATVRVGVGGKRLEKASTAPQASASNSEALAWQ